MGQYGNQPDFGTIVTTVTITGLDKEFPPSAIYVGQTGDNAPCNLEVLPVGNDPLDVVNITGIQPGTFLPIVITKIMAFGNVTASDILLYR